MCGIVGYIGKHNAVEVLLDGLSKLEYRGYDSSGIAIVGDGQITVEKAEGKLRNLQNKIEPMHLSSHIGIGHTRWATHGRPSDDNAHPHTSQNGKFAVVHNGIVENYLTLKETYLAGEVFTSETDTEVVAHLLEKFDTGNFEQTVVKVLNVLEGAYALVMVSADEPDKIIACRKDSPMVLGVGDGESFIASDVPALLAYTRKCMYIEKGELCILTQDGITIKNHDLQPIAKEVHNIEWDAEAAEKEGYDHFMLKEIFEQPTVFKKTLAGRIRDGQVHFDEFELTAEQVQRWKKIYIVACGSAYHTGVVAKYTIERLAGVPVETDLASEFRYRNPILAKNSMVIIISQSGETADSLAALRLAKERGVPVLSIVNVVGSSIARESDYVMYTYAGPEISVATTKAYSAQLIALYLLTIQMALAKECISDAEAGDLIAELDTLPTKIEKILEDKERIQWFASKYANAKDIFFIGRGIDYAICLEGSLKMKEISYIHSEAYAAGELKHGTISLVEDGTLVIGVLTQPELYEKTMSNMIEVKSRGAYLMGLTTYGNYNVEDNADFSVYVPKTHQLFTTSLAIIPLQLMGYYVSVAKGLDVDKPRNLAKSVTVE